MKHNSGQFKKDAIIAVLLVIFATSLILFFQSDFLNGKDKTKMDAKPVSSAAIKTTETASLKIETSSEETRKTETTELLDKQNELPSVAKPSGQEYLLPRALNTLGDSEFEEKVKRGYSLFVNTQPLRGKYVGNDQNCVNCHMGAGAKANAAPLWGAFMAYPAYRKKNDKVNTYEERIQGCFTYSMNGKAPEKNSSALIELSAYSYWLAMGALYDKYGMESEPIPAISDDALLLGGKAESFILPPQIAEKLKIAERGNLAGRGYPKLEKPAQAPSIERGEVVYNDICASCHGANGQGYQKDNVISLPPLWGKNSFTWGAGMHRINTAANFIYENMPLGKGTQLTVQEAWDAAAFMNSHERPQDPRFKGNLDETQKKFHNHQGYYGKKINQKVLGSNAFRSGLKN